MLNEKNPRRERNLTDTDIAAIATAINKSQEHCSFTEEERVIIKKFVRFLDRTAAKLGTVIIFAVLASMAAMWATFSAK